MLDHIRLETILFLDIETVPAIPKYDDLHENFKKLWDKKTQYLKKEKDTENVDELYKRAGIYAEFGKIICISVGMFITLEGQKGLKLKSFFDDDEKELLNHFIQLLNSLKTDAILCAHNGKEFDFPYLSRRILINGLPLPKLLDTAGKKPWEVNHLDTLDLWKFGDYKSYTSLELLATVFNIPTPKDDIDGSQVADVYWKDHDLDRIKTYCQKDVVTVAQLLLRFKGMDLIREENILQAS